MIYARNRVTGEHRAVRSLSQEDNYASSDKWDLLDADAEGWIPWSGGECPLPEGTRCDVKHRYGEVVRDTCVGRRGARRWAHTNLIGDIIAYRPILDASETEAPEWDGEGLPPVGAVCDCYHTGSHQGMVTVRYMGSEMCVLLNHGHGEEQCGPIDAYTFYSIRNPAQRAEEAMVAVAVSQNLLMSPDCARAIYAAIRDGKIPGVKLEDES